LVGTIAKIIMEITGILISLTLLIYLAYRGFSVIVIAPVLALAAVALSGEGKLMAYFTQVFMAGLAGFVLKYFPLFLLGSLFGKLMEDSGAAKRIAKTIVSFLGAKHALAAIVLACVVLTYGGVSLFVVVFAIFPIASELFKDAQIPKRLIRVLLVWAHSPFR
jgi:H+/gluconate symporter-like permease